MGKKKEFVIEYDFQSSPQLLFQYLSTPSGLSEWFSDDVNYRGEKYTFFWAARPLAREGYGKGHSLYVSGVSSLTLTALYQLGHG